jgi:hypothetical protein
MENRQDKPMTDLERIQQSYSSGSQTYTPVTKPEDRKDSTRESKSRPPSRESL